MGSRSRVGVEVMKITEQNWFWVCIGAGAMCLSVVVFGVLVFAVVELFSWITY